MKQTVSQLTQCFNRLSKTYDDQTDTFHHRITEYLTCNNLLLELPEDRNIRILDSGGGTGKFSLFLVKKGYTVELVDISEQSVEIAKKKAQALGLKLAVAVSNCEHTSYMDGVFDFIMMNGGVISNTPDPEALLNEAFRLLKQGGKLFFDFLNLLGWALEVSDAAYKAELALAEERLIQMADWDYPVRLLCLKRVSELLKKSGFKVLSTYGLVQLSNSLSLDMRYAKEYDMGLLEQYQKTELELSRRPECVASSWSCTVCAVKE